MNTTDISSGLRNIVSNNAKLVVRIKSVKHDQRLLSL